MTPDPRPTARSISHAQRIALNRAKIEAAWEKQPFTRVEDIFDLADSCLIARRYYGRFTDISKFSETLPFPRRRFAWLTKIAECEPLRQIDPCHLPPSIEKLYMLAGLNKSDLMDF